MKKHLFVLSALCLTLSIVSCGKKNNSSQDSNSSLVNSSLTDTSISQTLQIIKENPPKLDLHRKLNVYNARIKFIEIQLSGFNIKQHKVKITRKKLQKQNK